MKDGETLKIPVINIEYKEISLSIEGKGESIANDETINFTIDMPFEVETRNLSVDNTFVIFLVEKEKKDPYFACKISNITKFQ